MASCATWLFAMARLCCEKTDSVHWDTPAHAAVRLDDHRIKPEDGKSRLRPPLPSFSDPALYANLISFSSIHLTWPVQSPRYLLPGPVRLSGLGIFVFCGAQIED